MGGEHETSPERHQAPRVAFVFQGVRALYGAETVTIALIRELRRIGVDVEAVVLDEARLGLTDPPLPRALVSAGIPFETIPVLRAFDRDLVRALHDLVARKRYTILHVLGYKAHLHGALAGRVPVVSTVHGWLFRREVKERLYAWIEVQLLRRAAAVVCLTRFYEDLLLRRGVPRDRLVRIPSGLDLDTFPHDPPGIPASGVRTFGILGRLSSEKNHEMFLRAAARVARNRPEVRFLIAGDGPERARIEARVRELGLSSVVDLRGYMDAVAFFREIDALVLCSRIENLPMSILEAMAWAKPVIATRVGGIPDAVVDGETGLLVESDDDENLAVAMESMIRGPERAHAMGRHGRVRAIQEFSLERAAHAHVGLYGRIGVSR